MGLGVAGEESEKDRESGGAILPGMPSLQRKFSKIFCLKPNSTHFFGGRPRLRLVGFRLGAQVGA
jgi:hypothetical protein